MSESPKATRLLFVVEKGVQLTVIRTIAVSIFRQLVSLLYLYTIIEYT